MENNIYTIGAELDELAFRLESSARLVSLVHTAFVDGVNMPTRDDFEALYSIFSQQDAIAKEMRELTDRLCAFRDITAEHDGAADVLRALLAEYKAGKEGTAPRYVPEKITTPEAVKLYDEAARAMRNAGILNA